MARQKNNRKWLRLAFVLYPLVSVLAFVFSFIPRHYINKALGKINGFKGHIGGMTVTPFTINITIRNLILDIIHPTSDVQSVFLAVDSVRINIDWLKLWSGIVATEIVIDRPTVALSKDNVDRLKMGRFSIDDLGIGIQFKSVQIINGGMEYVDATTDPQIVIPITGIQLTIADIYIGESTTSTVWSDIFIKADVCQGKLNTKIKLDAQSPFPTFAMDTTVTGLNLVLLNSVFQAYGKFDLHSGVLNMRTEVEAREGGYKGYVEPRIDDLQVMGPEDKSDSMLNRLWEGLIGTIAGMLEDHSTDEISARITFARPFRNPNAHIVLAILEVLGNAFLHSLTPRMRNVVKIDL